MNDKAEIIRLRTKLAKLEYEMQRLHITVALAFTLGGFIAGVFVGLLANLT